MLYYANRDTVMEFYHTATGREGLCWLVDHDILYVIRGDNDSFQWILDKNKLDDAGQCPPFTEIITGSIITECENQGIEPVRTERA